MARTITFQPSTELSAFIDSQIRSGDFNSQSEVVRAGLRLLQEQTAASKLTELRQLIEVGEKSGDAVTWNVDAFLAGMETKQDDQASD